MSEFIEAGTQGSYCQAYSERTSWVMACMSELAYKRFNDFIPSINRYYNR